MATIIVCIAPIVKGKLYSFIIFPVKIMCVLQKKAPAITKESPNYKNFINTLDFL